jgi:D-proline reductase (dithiol) PrdB
VIEGRGIPTLVVGTAYDIMFQVKPPRAVFVDYPVGRTFGPPNQRFRQKAILMKALAEVPKFASAGEIRDLGCQWSASGSREWEQDLRTEMLHDR